MDSLGLPLAVIYILFIAALAVLLGLLFWAPMKLYGIYKELHMLNENFIVYAKRMKESQETQTKLLAAVANALNPVTACPEGVLQKNDV